MFRGVSLTIVPVLFLGTNFTIKVKQKASQACGRIISTRLDGITNIIDTKRIIDSTLALPHNTCETIMFFASPQALIDKSHRKQFINTLVAKNKIPYLLVGQHLFGQMPASRSPTRSSLSITGSNVHDSASLLHM